MQLYARHKEMKESLEKQLRELEEKKRRLESMSRPGTPGDNKGRNKSFPFRITEKK